MFVLNKIKKIFFELDGEQHFIETIFSKGKKLHYIQKHDKTKTSFVINGDKTNLIVRIPYNDNHLIKQILDYVLNNVEKMDGFWTTKPDMYPHLGIEARTIIL